ncbi:hypothetical protein JX265_009261 [Neoarthrinium moseri]|uniref:Uncharacterized protein n=1 Tax=Neoarthrinium moseri TaxID=1658444 RepID=A0A9Q0AMX9_9PEZI|nr:hypothetical protein JX265_009261 [Neoarthrinium moseri]
MEQPEPTAPPVDIPKAVSTQATASSPSNNASSHHHRRAPPAPTTRSATTSNSVPSLRFPRPAGNRQLTNWVSSSQPDIMRAMNFPDDAPLDASITDGYEVIGTDGESQSESAEAYDTQASEPGDDVQSLADTDTGTDAYTNDVDSDSSDEEEDDNHEEFAMEHTAEFTEHNAAQSDGEDHEIDMTYSERSLEHPTELFTSGSPHLSRQASLSGQDDHTGHTLQQARSSYEHLVNPNSETIKRPRKVTETTHEHSKADTSAEGKSFWRICKEMSTRCRHDRTLQMRALWVATLVISYSLVHSILLSDGTTSQSKMLSTVPVASVSSVSTSSTVDFVVSTSTVTSTVTATRIQSHALQTTSSSRGLANIPSHADLVMKKKLCSADTVGRNEILLRVPEQFKASWLAKQAVMISVSRGLADIPSESTKITSVEEGFVIEVPLAEAHGILDVSLATTRKPKINETFQVNFGRFMIGDAFDAGKQLMKGFAQTVVDTVNGTTAWVEETCIPAFDMMAKQASVPDSIMHGLREASSNALSLSSQISDQFKKAFTEERMRQAETELLRTAQDVRDDVALGLLRGQLSSKLWWLKVRGRTAEYEQYLAAAGPYYEQKQAEAAQASRARAERVREEVHARRRKEKREGRRSFWRAGEGGF